MNEKTLSIIVRAKDQASKVLGSVGEKAAIVGEKIKTAMKVAAAATATAFVALGAAAIKSTASLEQSFGGSSVVFGKYAKTIQETARNSAAVMGTSMDMYLQTANKMGSLFQGAGFSVQESIDMTAQAMQRATDVATAMGVSTEMALESIAGAAKGNFTMMDNLGVAMNDTTLNAYALEKGIGKTTEEMTNAEKVGLAMEMFLDRTSKYAGNYARENQTLAGSFQTLKSAWGNFIAGVEGSNVQLTTAASNMIAVLGQKVPEILSTLASNFTKVYDEIKKTNPWFGEFARVAEEAFGRVVEAYNYLKPKFDELWDTITNKLIPSLSRLWKEVIEPLLPVIGVALVVALGFVIDAANLLTEVFSKAMNALLDGNPIIWGLIGVIGTLAAAMALTAGLAAFNTAMATMRTQMAITSALVSSPMIMPAIAIGAAIAALVAVYNEAVKTKEAVESARHSSNAMEAGQNNAREMFRGVYYNGVSSAAKKAHAKKWLDANGWAEGGFTGRGGTNEVAGLVHKGEYVIPKSQVDQDTGLPVGGGVTNNFYGTIQLASAEAVDRFADRYEMGSLGVGI